jgi:phosphoribosylformimino-5-aminoimidazole carboxamide ribonucleotide (ProFAR) isomerase
VQEKGDKSMGVNPCTIIKTKISKDGYLHGKNTLIFSNLSGKFCPNK